MKEPTTNNNEPRANEPRTNEQRTSERQRAERVSNALRRVIASDACLVLRATARTLAPQETRKLVDIRPLRRGSRRALLGPLAPELAVSIRWRFCSAARRLSHLRMAVAHAPGRAADDRVRSSRSMLPVRCSCPRILIVAPDVQVGNRTSALTRGPTERRSPRRRPSRKPPVVQQARPAEPVVR